MSEKEGELKKRIDLAYEQIRKISGDVNWTLLMRNASKEILDEAKAEFPHRKLMYVTKESKLSDVHTTIEGEAYPIRCFDCSEINGWRRKWWGEAET